MPGLGSSPGRQAGRQLGVVGRTFLPLSLANPNPVSKLRSRALGCCVTSRSQPAVGGRKGSLPLARAGGTGRGGRPGRGSGVRTMRAPCTTQTEAQLHPRSHPGDLTPAPQQIDGDQDTQRDAGTQSGTQHQPVHHPHSSPTSWDHLPQCRLICHDRKKNTWTQRSSSRSPALVPGGTEHPSALHNHEHLAGCGSEPLLCARC